jgi:predicted metal-dependent peptidase
MKSEKPFFDLSTYASQLFSENIFFNAFSRYFVKRSDNTMPTFAAVTYDSKRKMYIMYYNSSMLLYAQSKMEKSMFDLFLRDLISHEMLHPAVGHFQECRYIAKEAKELVERTKTANPAEQLRIKSKLRKINISMDLSINHYLREGLQQPIPILTDNGKEEVFKGCFPEDYNLPQGMSSAWYYANVKDDACTRMEQMADSLEKMQNSDDFSKMVEGLLNSLTSGPFDDHGGMLEDSDGTNPCNSTRGDSDNSDTNDRDCNDKDSPCGDERGDSSWADVVLKDAISQSVRAAMRVPSNRYGKLPISIVKQLEAVAGIGEVDWKTYFDYFCRGRARGEKKKRISIKNRKYDMFPGTVRVRRPKIAIAYDQSGSVSDHMLQELDKQLQSLSDLVDFTIVPFDCTVDEDNIREFKKGHRYDLKRTRSGGTDFDAPTDWVNKNRRKFDGFIIATDMCAPQPGPSIVPRLWLTVEGCEMYGEWNLQEPILKVRPKDG